MSVPRKAKMSEWVPAERATFDAMQAVEKMPGHPLLTEAVILLGQAQDKIAEYVDMVQLRQKAIIISDAEIKSSFLSLIEIAATHGFPTKGKFFVVPDMDRLASYETTQLHDGVQVRWELKG